MMSLWHMCAAYAYENNTKLPLKTSIIVPCCAQHAEHLYGLVRLYESQTVLPDEIVISLSESDKVPHAIIDALQKEAWRFPVILLLSQEKLFAGQNRNIACEHAKGDIFICQDADDFPHPQRVEIIKYFFQKYKIKHLMHLYSIIKPHESGSTEIYTDLSKITYSFPRIFEMVYGQGTNGNVAMLKSVFDKLRWSSKPRGQDTEFNAKVYKRTRIKERIFIAVPLLLYRQYLSSEQL